MERWYNPFDYSKCRSHSEIDAKRNFSLFVLVLFAIVFFMWLNA